MRKTISSVAGAAVVLMALAGCANASGDSGSGDDAASKTLTLGLEGPWAASYTVLALAEDALKEEGYTIEETLFDTPETLSQAVATGQVNIGVTSSGTVFSAVDAGAPVKAFLGLNRPDYVMVAKAGLDSCESLDGKRLAIHSREGTTGTLTGKWISEVCPDTEPNMLIVPGTENRIAGLIADQIDALPVDLIASMQLTKQYPDTYTLIDGYGDPDIMAAYFYAQSDYLEKNSEAAQDFTDAYLDALDDVKADPTAAKERLAELLPDIDKTIAEDLVQYWVDNDMWAAAEGVQDDMVSSTIDLFAQTTPYENITEPSDVVTDEFVAAHG